MKDRINAVKVISKRMIFEVFISPALYVMILLGLLIGFTFIIIFVTSIDSSGFDLKAKPIEFLFNSFSGMFGLSFVEKLFAEGPFFFALFIAFLPFLLYLIVSSVYKFGLEKNTGAIELIVCGPADGTTYFLAALLRNVIYSALYLVILTVYFLITAFIFNLVLGPMFFSALFLLFFFAVALSCYGILTSSVSDNAATATFFFVGFLVFFTLVQIGSYAIVGGYVKNLSFVIASLVQWLSPYYFWTKGLAAFDYGDLGGYLLYVLFFMLLSAGLLVISHFILKYKGVRS